jgi:hypothetical protein
MNGGRRKRTIRRKRCRGRQGHSWTKVNGARGWRRKTRRRKRKKKRRKRR